jgi:hypothetical protein
MKRNPLRRPNLPRSKRRIFKNQTASNSELRLIA